MGLKRKRDGVIDMQNRRGEKVEVEEAGKILQIDRLISSRRGGEFQINDGSGGRRETPVAVVTTFACCYSNVLRETVLPRGTS